MYSIGLDIGIASVGWSVIDSETGYIDDLGVRLFPSRNSDHNADRRNARGSRRLLNRRRTRLNDAETLLHSVGIEHDKSFDNDSPYDIRVKGLNEKLEPGEIYRAVKHIVKKRGISYLDEDELDDGGEGATFKDAVNENAKLLQVKTPGEIQLERLRSDGRVRTGYNDKNEYQLNVFTVRAYAEELKRILTTQQKYYPQITDDFIKALFEPGTAEEAGLIYRKRPYYHGPGNAANNSEYGRWADYAENGKPADNIFDQLIGKDIIGEIRGSNLGLTAQKYNLLNDLNNLILDRDNPKVTTEEKEEIIHELMSSDIKSFGARDMAKMLGFTKVEDIKGWRVNKNDKPEIHSMKTYRDWRKVFAEYGVELNDVSDEIVDELGFIIMLNTEKDAVVSTLNNRLPNLDQKIYDIVVEEFLNLRKKASLKSWHSFSNKLMKQIIPDLLHTCDEQNTILERMGIKRDLRGKYASLNKVPINEIVEDIYNPTVTRSIRQALKVFNALVKRYGKENISHVTVEMPRDKNEDDQKQTIKDIQKSNENRKKKSRQYFLDKSGWSEEYFDAQMYKTSLAKKLNYYYEQDGKCAYSGEPIKPDDLLSNKTEIDHIIPLSISLDDSINNKVLVTAKANQAKGQRSPWQAFNDGAEMGRSWDDYEAWVIDRKYKKYKKNNLLLKEDIFKPEVQQRFVSRNLNDTRYSSRVVLNTLQSFFYETGTKVKVVNGSYTHTLRKKWDNLDKTRETHHHHAVDATLCAVTPFVNIARYEYRSDEKGNYMIDTQTGEMIDYSDYKKLKYYDKKNYVPIWDDFIERLIPTDLYPQIKFSHQVDRKWNRKVSDATIYSTRERKVETKKGVKTEEYVIDKIKDIYSAEGWKKFDKKRDDLLMKEFDEQTYEKLIDIADKYVEIEERETDNGDIKAYKVSPFKKYCEDNEVPYIRKYSKKGNGPFVKAVKYYNKKIGSHVNITKDQDGNPVDSTVNNKKVILLQQNPWRTDVYYDAEKDLYQLVGIKYADCKFVDGEYGVPKEKYEELKKTEKVSGNSEFRFSLYRNDGIRVDYDGEIIEGLYQSRTMANANYFEMKPIEKSKWDGKQVVPIFGTIAGSGQFVKSIKRNYLIRKINTDILGKKYYVTQEELKGIIE